MNDPEQRTIQQRRTFEDFEDSDQFDWKILDGSREDISYSSDAAEGDQSLAFSDVGHGVRIEKRLSEPQSVDEIAFWFKYRSEKDNHLRVWVGGPDTMFNQIRVFYSAVHIRGGEDRVENKDVAGIDQNAWVRVVLYNIDFETNTLDIRAEDDEGKEYGRRTEVPFFEDADPDGWEWFRITNYIDHNNTADELWFDAITYRGGESSDEGTGRASDPTPEAFYNFESTGPKIVDQTDNGHSGRLRGASRVDGRGGTVLDFDASNEELAEVGSANTLNPGSESYTLSFWFRSDGVQNRDNEKMISKRRGGGDKFIVDIQDVGNGEGRVRAGGWGNRLYSGPKSTSATTYTDGQWHHVAVVLDRSTDTSELYVDEEMVGSGKINVDELDPSTPIYLGGQGGYTNPRYFTGQMDDLRVYRDAVRPSREASEPEVTLNVTGGTVDPGGQLTLRFEVTTSAATGNEALCRFSIGDVSTGLPDGWRITDSAATRGQWAAPGDSVLVWDLGPLESGTATGLVTVEVGEGVNPGEYPLNAEVEIGSEVIATGDTTIKVAGDDDPTPTTTTTTTADRPASGYPDGEARIDPVGGYSYFPIEVGDTEYYVLRDVELESGVVPWAVTYVPEVGSSTLELVPLLEAYDPMATFTWRNRLYADYESAIERAENDRDAWKIGEVLNRAADIGANALAAYALTSVSRTAGIGRVLEVLDDSISWAKAEFGNRYQESLSQIYGLTASQRRVERAVEGITRMSGLSDRVIGSLEALDTAYGTISDTRSVVSAMTSAAKLSRSGTTAVRNAVVAGGGAAAGPLMFIAADQATAAITGGYEAVAKVATIGHAAATVRLPHLRRLRDLSEKALQGRLTPPEAVEFQHAEAAQHLIEAVASGAMAAYANSARDGLLGPLYDVINNLDDIARTAEQAKQDQREAAAVALETGTDRFRTARQRLGGSVNFDRWQNPRILVDEIPGGEKL